MSITLTGSNTLQSGGILVTPSHGEHRLGDQRHRHPVGGSSRNGGQRPDDPPEQPEASLEIAATIADGSVNRLTRNGTAAIGSVLVNASSTGLTTVTLADTKDINGVPPASWCDASRQDGDRDQFHHQRCDVERHCQRNDYGSKFVAWRYEQYLEQCLHRRGRDRELQFDSEQPRHAGQRASRTDPRFDAAWQDCYRDQL